MHRNFDKSVTEANAGDSIDGRAHEVGSDTNGQDACPCTAAWVAYEVSKQERQEVYRYLAES
jgi:hypothetical protein